MDDTSTWVIIIVVILIIIFGFWWYNNYYKYESMTNMNGRYNPNWRGPGQWQKGQWQQGRYPTTPRQPNYVRSPYRSPRPTPRPGRKNSQIYLFYSQNCPACQRFKPVWDKIHNDINVRNTFPNVDAIPIDVDDPKYQNLVDKYKISQVPTLIYKTPNRNFKYEGPHDYQRITDWIASRNPDLYQGQPVPEGPVAGDVPTGVPSEQAY